jgi:putative membrane protein
MILASLLFAFIAALLHVYIFTMESVTWTTPATWKRFGLASQADAETTKLLAYNQGFYNLFLAAGTLIGVGCVAFAPQGSVQPVVGWTLVFSCCGSMLLAAVVLALSESTSAPRFFRAPRRCSPSSWGCWRWPCRHAHRRAAFLAARRAAGGQWR